MKLRTTYAGFVQAVDAFLDKLVPKMVPLQVGSVHIPRNACLFFLIKKAIKKDLSRFFCSSGKAARLSLCRWSTNTGRMQWIKNIWRFSKRYQLSAYGRLWVRILDPERQFGQLWGQKNPCRTTNLMLINS